MFCLYSLFHAFSNAVLARGSRLALSIWSSIIMLLFAADNMYGMYHYDQIENMTDLYLALYAALQFFLLGVSSMYIVQNFFMLTEFFPGKHTFFNKEYFRDLKELKKKHIDRYSTTQVNPVHSLFCVLFAGSFFAINYHYQLLPRHLAIWIVLFSFPYVIMIFNFLRRN